MRALVLIVAAASLAAGCNPTSNKFSRASMASDAKVALVGKSRGEILACMGTPQGSAKADGVEVFSYTSGGDTQTFSDATLTANNGYVTGFGSSDTYRRYCKVDIVFEGDAVTRVNYSGRTGGLLTQGEQCAFAVAPCVGQ